MKAEATHGHSVAYVLQSAWQCLPENRVLQPPQCHSKLHVSAVVRQMKCLLMTRYSTSLSVICYVLFHHSTQMYFSVADTLKEIKKK